MARKPKPGAPKAPYESTHKRVPVPVSEHVQEVIDWYRNRLREGYKAKELPNLSKIILFGENLEIAVEEIEKVCAEINEYERIVTSSNGTEILSHDRIFIAKSPLYGKMKNALSKAKKILEVNQSSQEIEESKLPELPPYLEQRVFTQERNLPDFHR